MKRIGTFSLLLCMMLMMVSAVSASTEDRLDKIITIEIKDGTVAEALERIFQMAGTAYVINADACYELVPPVSFTNTSARTALDSLTRALGLVYRVDSDVIYVSKKPQNQAKIPPVSIDVKDTPLKDVIDMLFKITGGSYTIDPSVTDLKVTAKLQNVPFQEALKTVVSTSGLVYRISGNTYRFSPRPVINATPTEESTTDKPMVTEVVTLTQKIISSGDIASVIAKPGKVSVTTVGPDKLLITGSREDVDEALKLVRALDMEGPLTRPIRIKLEAQVTSPSMKKPAVLTTESVGAEGSSIPLNANTNSAIPYDVTTATIVDGKAVQNKITQFIQIVGGLFVDLTPTLGEDGRISLSGSGQLTHVFLGDKKPGQTVPEQIQFDKHFEVAISVPQGQPTVIATASYETDTHTAELEITATASVEEGMVRAPVQNSNQPSFGRPGYSSYGGGYSGGFGGGFGGSSYGGFGGSTTSRPHPNPAITNAPKSAAPRAEEPNPPAKTDKK